MSPSIERRPEPATSECPVCRGRDTGPYAVGHDRFFRVAPGSFPLHRCAGCDCIFQFPLPAESSLAAHYPETYWWSAASSRPSVAKRTLLRLEGRYRELVTTGHVRFLQKCARNAGTGSRILLDIGCGNGTFLHLAQRRGFQAHGMDASQQAVEVACRQYRLPVRRGVIGQDLWPGYRFDFVTMFHVLEHVPDPRKALDYAASLLRPGGRLLIQLPNVGSIQARLFRERWYGLDVPRHVINYSPGGLALLLRETGWRICARARFSLRDNPASLASSLVPSLDPLGRKARMRQSLPAAEAALEVVYLGVFLLSLPPAWLEGVLGYGGTIWVAAERCA